MSRIWRFTRPMVRTGSGGFYDGMGFNYPGVQVARDGRLGAERCIRPTGTISRRASAWPGAPTDQWAVRMGAGVFYVQDAGTTTFDMARMTSGAFDVLPNNNYSSHFHRYELRHQSDRGKSPPDPQAVPLRGGQQSTYPAGLSVDVRCAAAVEPIDHAHSQLFRLDRTPSGK